jgi:uncharacterized protein with von Willebrand factor type A (vWA) domain
MQPQNDLSGFEPSILNHLQVEYSEIWDDKIDKKVIREVYGYRETLKNKLLSESPYIQNRAELIQAERDQRYFGGSESTIRQDLNNYKKLCPKIDGSFWLAKLIKANSMGDKSAMVQTKPHERRKTRGDPSTSLKKQDTAIRRNLQESWRKDYGKMEMEWELNEIDKFRKQIIAEYSQWLDKISEISKTLKTLGLECGLLWDLSVGSLSDQDVSQLLKWAKYLHNNSGIKKLCDLMGKMAQESFSHELVKIQTSHCYEVQKTDINSREEITGITLGNDLENLIPQELSYLTDPDISILFDLKFVENRLMCFEKQGVQTTWEEELKEEEKQVNIYDKKGPIIICVDTSGSMSGAPETIAKAFTLLLSTQAANQKRPCYLINFGTGIETTDLQPPKCMKDLIQFLKKSFHGGTDVAPALYEAVHKMANENYSKADLLVISDFVLSIIDGDLRKTVQEQKLKDNRFYALSIGQFRLENVDDLFNLQWNYDATKGTISQLNNVVEWVSGKVPQKLRKE